MLSGVIGAFVAPLAGRLADSGHGQAVTDISIALLAITFALTWLAKLGLAGAVRHRRNCS